MGRCKKLKLKGKLSKDDVGKAMADFKVQEELLREKERLRRILVLSQRLDNVLQHTPQSVIKILFILVSLSSTAVPTVRGVEAVWNSLEVDASWFDKIQFHLSTVLSLVGVSSGLFSVHMYSKHSSVPLLPGQLLLRLLYIVSGGTRILCLILLAAPYLGLFGLMEPIISVTSSTTPDLMTVNYTQATRRSYAPSANVSEELVRSMQNQDW